MAMVTLLRAVDGHVQPTIAISMPLRPGPEVSGKRPRTTVYGGLSAGAIGDSDGPLAGSLDVSILGGASSDESSWLTTVQRC